MRGLIQRPEPVRMLTLYQPHAGLMCTGAKRIETRGWATNYRGPLVIHAAARRREDEVNFYLMEPDFQAGLAPLVGRDLDLNHPRQHGVTIEHLVFGAALCVVDLVDCVPISQMTPARIGTDRPFGVYELGRFAWITENRRVFPEPVRTRGAQGLIRADFDVEAALGMKLTMAPRWINRKEVEG